MAAVEFIPPSSIQHLAVEFILPTSIQHMAPVELIPSPAREHTEVVEKKILSPSSILLMHRWS